MTAEPQDHAEPWERQPKETAKAFHAFRHYRDLGASRSCDKAWRAHRASCVASGEVSEDAAEVRQKRVRSRAPRNWSDWSVKHRWAERAQAFDSEVDADTRRRLQGELHKTRERTARQAAEALEIVAKPVQAAIEVLEDGSALQALVTSIREQPERLLKLFALVARVAPAMAILVKVEREALGLATESAEIKDRAEDQADDRLTEAMRQDPEVRAVLARLIERDSMEPKGRRTGAAEWTGRDGDARAVLARVGCS